MPKGKVTGKTRLPTKAQKITIPKAGTEKRFQAESDVRTLQNAAEIKADSSRLRMAKNLANKQAQQLRNITK